MDRITTLKEKSVISLSSLRESTAPAKNQSVLNNLGENADGNLTYKGEVVGGVESKIQMAEFIVDDSNATIHTQDGAIITVEANIPVNARVKKIEIPDVVNGTDEYIALEDMISKDPTYGLDTPYFIMYPKGKVGRYSPFVAAAVVFPYYVGNSYYEQLDSFYDKTIKIYYEIEE